MIKLLLINIFIGLSLASWGQDSLGIDNKTAINAHEAAWFNKRFKLNKLKEHYFDFNGAKVGFVYIDKFEITTKQDFFDQILKRDKTSKKPSVDCSCMTLSANERNETGLDVIILMAEKPLSLTTEQYNTNCKNATQLFKKQGLR